MRITYRLQLALRWWRRPYNLARGSRLGPVTRRRLVSADASLAGWGAVHEGAGIGGRWDSQWASQHINVLELEAAQLALRGFIHHLQGHHVLLRTDSVVAAAYINRQGGLGSPRLSRLAHVLWEWASSRLLSLRAVQVPGLDNQAADCLSRGGPSPGEWRLHPEVVGEIWRRFGTPVADLFASRESTHLTMFFSIGRDSPPLGTDALARRWPQGLLYAFPPFGLLPSLLQRVWEEEVQLVLIAPLWPHMIWFSDIPPLVCGEPWELPSRRDLLSQAQGTLFHPFPQGLRLWAWPLRGPAS